MNMPLGTERRRVARIPLQLPVTVKLGEMQFESVTTNVSSSGVLLSCAEEVGMDSSVELTLTLPEEITQVEPLRVRCKGHVVRVDLKDNKRVGLAVKIASYEVLAEKVSC